MKSVLITGGTGFIGSYLLDRLREERVNIRVVTRRRPKNKEYLGDIEYRTGDLVEPKTLQGVCQDIDTVFHLGGYAHALPKLAKGNEHLHQQINLQGTQNLARVAIDHGVERFVYVSSVKAGGEHRTVCLDEASTLEVVDDYGRAKRQAEDWLIDQSGNRLAHIAIIRPTLVYGEGVKGNLAAMLKLIDRGLFPPIPETRNKRSMVDVRDLAEAIYLAAKRTEANGKRYIISDGKDYSSQEIYSAMCKALGRSVPNWSMPRWSMRGIGVVGDLGQRIFRRGLPFNSSVASRLLDSACYRSTNANQDLGFVPKYTFEESLPDIVAAFRRQ